MAFSETLACGLQKCVGNLWKGDDFSDFTVVVEDTSFKCHRFILSACSGFFQGLFKSQMKEQLESCATLEGMTAVTFEIIIDALYKGIEGLSNDNVLDVWSATELLQIHYLTEECQKFVIQNFSVDTCFRILNHAMLYAAQKMIDGSLDFISRHFKSLRGVDDLLQLPFDYFYKVIAHDYLATDSEDLVVDTVLKWVKYVPLPTPSTSLPSEKNNRDIDDTRDGDDASPGDDTNDKQSDCQTPSRPLSISGNLENRHNNQLLASYDITKDQTDRISGKMETREKAESHSVVPVGCNNASKDDDNGESKIENRKQYLFQLMSACKLFTIKPAYLDNVMKNHAQLLVNTGAYNLMHEARMYISYVDRRHDSWPEAAVHRASSSNKHVMVFVSNDKVMAYSLNTGSVHEFAELPDNCKSSNFTTVVFDNILYLLTNDERSSTKELYMLTKEKTWLNINSIKQSSLITLLPHGNHIYYVYLNRYHYIYTEFRSLWRFCCVYGHDKIWTKCAVLSNQGNCLVRFNEYILVFSNEEDEEEEEKVITAECYNTETHKTHECPTSMDRTSRDMVSFRHEDVVYILQRNGTLLKVFSTDTTPVHFDLVSKLWDFDCSLKGCVLYRKQLVVFCDNNECNLMKSLPGIFSNIKIIKINTKTPCLPMILNR